MRRGIVRHADALGERLLERLYLPDGSKNKWWAMFSRRKFMGIELTDERRR